jgi:hypothetical protein
LAVVLAVSAAGCSGGSDPRFGNVIFSTGVDDSTGAPVERTSEFAPDAAAVYASVPVEDLGEGETVTFRWYHLGEQVLLTDFTLPEEFDQGWVWSALEPTAPLPPGEEYRVEVHHGGVLVSTAPFAVVDPTAEITATPAAPEPSTTP